MEIINLKEFIALADRLNYLEAADDLFISQSTLSRHIQRLEQELGCELFIRSSRTVQLSKDGKMLLPYAAKIVETYNEYEARAKIESRVKSNTFVIGSVPFMSHYKLLELITRFRKRYPDTDVEIMECETRHLKNKLRDGKCDVAFVFETEDEPCSGPHIIISEESFAALVPTANHADTSRVLDLGDVDGKLMLLEDDAVLYETPSKALREFGRDIAAPVKITKKHIAKALADGVGAAVVPRSVAVATTSENFSIMNLPVDIPVRMVLAVRDDKPSQMAEQFIELCGWQGRK